MSRKSKRLSSRSKNYRDVVSKPASPEPHSNTRSSVMASAVSGELQASNAKPQGFPAEHSDTIQISAELTDAVPPINAVASGTVVIPPVEREVWQRDPAAPEAIPSFYEAIEIAAEPSVIVALGSLEPSAPTAETISSVDGELGGETERVESAFQISVMAAETGLSEAVAQQAPAAMVVTAKHASVPPPNAMGTATLLETVTSLPASQIAAIAVEATASDRDIVASPTNRVATNSAQMATNDDAAAQAQTRHADFVVPTSNLVADSNRAHASHHQASTQSEIPSSDSAKIEIDAPVVSSAVGPSSVPVAALPVVESVPLPLRNEIEKVSEPLPEILTSERPGQAIRSTGQGHATPESSTPVSAAGLLGTLAEARFADHEEAFFARGTAPMPTQVFETFDDLDADYDLPQTTWQKLKRRPGQPLIKLEKPKK